jgi:hypothetical protein
MFLIGEKAQAPFVTVWSVEDKGSYVQARISTSEKDNREEGKYINSNWFARFVGGCKEEALDLSERDRIKITSGKITNILSGEGDNKRNYLNVTIFGFEVLPQSGGSSKFSGGKPKDEEFTDDDIPF